MKMSDIRVGSEYAYLRGKHWDVRRVRVVEVEVMVRPKTSAGPAKPRGVVIETLDGTTSQLLSVPVVLANTLIPWADHEANLEAQRQRKQEAATRQARVYAERAAFVVALHHKMVEAGFSRPRYYAHVTVLQVHDALIAAGLPEAPLNEHRGGFDTPVSGLDRLMNDGKITLTIGQATALIGLTAPQGLS